MKKLPFKKSTSGSIGIELEFQMLNPRDSHLFSCAKNLIRNINASKYASTITPEVTQSTIEINSAIHHSPQSLLEELVEVQNFLLNQAIELDFAICGGGIHPFDGWRKQKIFPKLRYKKILNKLRYLLKQTITYGQHIHIGCKNPEDALYLNHAFIRYVPQLIAITASSPFHQGVDTDYVSWRSQVLALLPSQGVTPYLLNWLEFSDYFYKMHKWGLATTMKDLHWDVRVKPEFGTVEIRVCDSPLTLQKAVRITAYAQAIASYLLEERPISICHEIYYLHSFNRFQASRFGFSGDFINPYTSYHCSILEDIEDTLKKVKPYANQLGSLEYINQLQRDAVNNRNDAAQLRALLKETKTLPKMMAKATALWARSPI